VWFFSSFETVQENASVAYSPASMTQFNALSQLAAQGLITGAPSIASPPLFDSFSRLHRYGAL
jgi:hypothetical protein